MFKRIVDELAHLFNPAHAESSALLPFRISFPGGTIASAIRVSQHGDPAAVVEALKMRRPTPSIVIMGGAGLMDAQSSAITRSLIEDGLAAFAEQHAVTIVDGGTSAGVMELMGKARARRKYNFALVGVAPDYVVEYPGRVNPNVLGILEPNHTHFVLTSGENFGDESEMLAGVGWAVAQGDGESYKTLGLIINGGGIVAKEAHARATGTLRFPLLALEGSGRFADELATALKTGESDDRETQEILRAGAVQVFDMHAGAEQFRRWLAGFFGF